MLNPRKKKFFVIIIPLFRLCVYNDFHLSGCAHTSKNFQAGFLATNAAQISNSTVKKGLWNENNNNCNDDDYNKRAKNNIIHNGYVLVLMRKISKSNSTHW